MNDEEFEKLLEERRKKYAEYQNKRTPSPWDSLNKQLGYDKAFKAETKDGLIALDFRTIDQPSFMTWAGTERRFSDDPFQNENGIDYKIFHFELYWGNATLSTTINVVIWVNYDLAHEAFRRRIETGTSSMSMYDDWMPCKKSIGTACASTDASSMFTYKNVLVHVETNWFDKALVSKSPNGDPWDMVFAEWVFDILKSAPRFKEFPSEPQPGNRR